jgi:hypothetical protein
MKKNGIYKLQTDERELLIETQYGFRKRLTLTVYPDQRIIARIPYGLSTRRIEDYLHKKTSWMIKHLDHFKHHSPEKEKHFVDGELHDHLGKSYKLRLKTGTPKICIQQDELIVQMKNILDKDAVAARLMHWYRKEAIQTLTPRYEQIYNDLQYLELPATQLQFRKMKRRWGSCSSKGSITLNTELIKKDFSLIDYVIVHEICHLKVPAHNKAFYSLVESILPDWKKRKKLLNT